MLAEASERLLKPLGFVPVAIREDGQATIFGRGKEQFVILSHQNDTFAVGDMAGGFRAGRGFAELRALLFGKHSH